MRLWTGSGMPRDDPGLEAGKTKAFQKKIQSIFSLHFLSSCPSSSSFSAFISSSPSSFFSSYFFSSPSSLPSFILLVSERKELDEVVNNRMKELRADCFSFYIVFFSFFENMFIYFNWRLITLQYCIGFAIHQHELIVFQEWEARGFCGESIT